MSAPDVRDPGEPALREALENEIWGEVIEALRPAWPERAKLLYCASPVELIWELINERDAALTHPPASPGVEGALRVVLDEWTGLRQAYRDGIPDGDFPAFQSAMIASEEALEAAALAAGPQERAPGDTVNPERVRYVLANAGWKETIRQLDMATAEISRLRAQLASRPDLGGPKERATETGEAAPAPGRAPCGFEQSAELFGVCALCGGDADDHAAALSRRVDEVEARERLTIRENVALRQRLDTLLRGESALKAELADAQRRPRSTPPAADSPSAAPGGPEGPEADAGAARVTNPTMVWDCGCTVYLVSHVLEHCDTHSTHPMGAARVAPGGPACRRCTDCEGQEHHWIEGVAMVCKHCEATRPWTDDDEDEADDE